MRKVKIGAPGFILADEMERDFRGTVRKIAELGYDGIEVTGFFGHTAEEFNDVFGEAGIEAFSCFALTPFMLCKGSALEDNMKGWSKFQDSMRVPGRTPDETMAYVHQLGCRYLGLCVPREEPGQAFYDEVKVLSDVARAHGITVQYHNHDFEYTNMKEGEYRIDTILKSLPPEVNFEPDLGWMAIGGYDPFQAIERYKERIEIVHLKDFHRGGSNILDRSVPFEFRPTGFGVMDWARLISVCEEKIQPKWYVLDHDKAATPEDTFAELGMCLDYVRKQMRFL